MKTNWLVGSIILAGAMVLRAQTNDLSAALRQGLFEEEANRNLDAAVSNYQALVTQFDQDRQLAATAIFRLGECYRKLGRTNDAVVQYQRIFRDFADQQTLVTLSQQNLNALHAVVPPRWIAWPQLPAPAGTFQERLQAIIAKNQQDLIAPAAVESAAKAAELEAEAAQLKAQVGHLLDLKREQRLVEVQQSYSNPVLTKLVQDLTDAEQKFAVLTNDYSSQDMHIVRATAQVNAINGQIDTQVEGVIKGLQAKMEADLNAAKTLRDKSGPIQVPEKQN
ncbi:MAG: tetratricopeptide repeat protein [Limisphaerales bacterium]